jgi:O-methyltransferase
MPSETTAPQRTLYRAAHSLGARSRLGRRLIRRASQWTTLQKLLLGGPTILRPWESDEQFRAAAKDPISVSLCTPESLYTLYEAMLCARNLDGDVAEVGVFTGGSAMLLARLLADTGKDLFLFDTFEGLPESTDEAEDRAWKSGDLSASLDAVKRRLAPWDTVHFAAGTFPDTAAVVGDRSFALVHVDVDIQQSVHDCCEFFYPRVVPGGVIVFDDYGYRSCPGARAAVDEFFADRPEAPFYVPTGQALIWKRAED